MQETGTGRNRPILRSKYKTPFLRYSSFITASMIIRKLNEEGCHMTGSIFFGLMLKENLFMMTKRGKRWTCEPFEARLIVELVKEWYGKKNLLSDPPQV